MPWTPDKERILKLISEDLDTIAKKVFGHDGPYDGDDLFLRIEELVEHRAATAEQLERAYREGWGDRSQFDDEGPGSRLVDRLWHESKARAWNHTWPPST